MTQKPFNPFSAASDKVQELKDVLKGKKDASAAHAPEAALDAHSSAESKESFESGVAADSLHEEMNALQSKMKETEEEMKKHKDHLLRTLAEFDNFRKRMEREKGETIKYSNEKLLKELLPMLDHLEMTLAHSKQQSLPKPKGDEKKPEDPVVTGLQLVVKQFLGILQRFGVELIEGDGLAFDPNRQEAIASVESSQVNPGHVVCVHRKGFALQDRVIRPALVTVAKSVEEEEKEEKEEIMH